MDLPGKPPRASRAEMLELVLPSDANPLGTIFGGRVMQWIDIAASLCAMRHSGNVVVTASMDDLDFHSPIQVGEAAHLDARPIAAFHTSVVCGVTVHAENPRTGVRRLCTTALLTFVALDENRKPTTVPPVIPETEEEHRLYDLAVARREARQARG